MKYKIFPKDYDPVVADGPPGEDIEPEYKWTAKDTKRQRALAKKYKIIEVKDEKELPLNRWSERLDNN